MKYRSAYVTEEEVMLGDEVEDDEYYDAVEESGDDEA